EVDGKGSTFSQRYMFNLLKILRIDDNGNLIWAFMAIVGIVYAMFNGTMGDVNKALFESANEAVTLSIGLISVLVFWLGMMNIAKHAGVLDKLATLFKPFIHWLFPDIPKGHP